MTTQQVTLRPMSPVEYAEATRRREADAARELAEFLPEELAWERSRQGTARFLPNGRDTAGNHLVMAENTAGVVVGSAWVGPDPRGASGSAWLYDVVVFEPFRRRGYGVALLAAVERLVAGEGMSRLGLNVVGDNAAAIGLYRRAGYRVSSMFLDKDVDGEDVESR